MGAREGSACNGAPSAAPQAVIVSKREIFFISAQAIIIITHIVWHKCAGFSSQKKFIYKAFERTGTRKSKKSLFKRGRYLVE